MASEYKYLFRLGRGSKAADLLGPSIAYFWNDIYDLMDLHREMTVERLDGKVFTFSEVRRLAKDLHEDMEEDDAVIWVEVEDAGKRLRFLEIDNLPAYDLDEMQRLVENYLEEPEQTVIAQATKETRILHFPKKDIIVYLIHLDNFESLIEKGFVEELMIASKKEKAKRVFLVSSQEPENDTAKLLKTSKITLLRPDEMLRKINKQNLDLALDNLHMELSAEKKSVGFEKDKLRIFLDFVKNASSNVAKKNALENLADYLLSNLEGFRVIRRNYRGPSEEIDLLVANESNDTFLRLLGTPILVECRHRKGPATSRDVRDFKGKLEGAGLKSGILITLRGIAGDKYDAIAVVREGRKSGISIIVINMDDLTSICESKDPLEVIKECFYRYV